jgi:hypothetical protein
MGKLLMAVACALVLCGCKSDDAARGGVGGETNVQSGASSNSNGNGPQRGIAPNINMRNWSTEYRY